VNPPAEICVQGDVAFDPRGIVLGSNEQEFWLTIRLKEISTCWRGSWAEAGYVDGLMINPKVVLEAFGIMASDSNESWSLSKEKTFDVLTKSDEQAEIIRKIYVDNCNYFVRKIEYHNLELKTKNSKLIVELDKYEQVVKEFFVPKSIKITKYGESVKDLTSITFSLTSVKSDSISSKQRNLLFTHPEPKGFKHVFINVDGNWIEQKQD